MTIRWHFLIMAVLLLAGCDDMTHQPRQKEYSPNVGPAQRPAGVVRFDEKPAPVPPVTLALLQRGQTQFRVFCTPCHSELGDGKGMIVERGFPQPPSYTSQKLLNASPEHFFEVITHGWGVMYSFEDRIVPQDRWAIAAYIKALQLSQHASVDDLTPAERKLLQ